MVAQGHLQSPCQAPAKVLYRTARRLKPRRERPYVRSRQPSLSQILIARHAPCIGLSRPHRCVDFSGGAIRSLPLRRAQACAYFSAVPSAIHNHLVFGTNAEARLTCRGDLIHITRQSSPIRRR